MQPQEFLGLNLRPLIVYFLFFFAPIAPIYLREGGGLFVEASVEEENIA